MYGATGDALLQKSLLKLPEVKRGEYYYYYYYSHIFPDSRAQHCNYATLLAGSEASPMYD